MKELLGDSLRERGISRRALLQYASYMTSLLALPPGCAFAPRCPRADAACGVMPDLAASGTRSVRCHHPLAAEAVQ